MLKKVQVLSAGIPLAILAGFALAYLGLKNRHYANRYPSKVEIHGEPIVATALPESSVVKTSTGGSPNGRHPKPPPVQTRMMLAQISVSGQTNPDQIIQSAGTMGTAADLAKTNLRSASGLPPIHATPGYEEINFSALSDFEFVLGKEAVSSTANQAQTAAKAMAQIPQSVRSLNGKKIVIQGFLLPVKMDDGLAVEFLLMRNQSMCCYGVPLKINEWITVQLTGKGVKPVMDQPVAVQGTLHVGATEENGFLTGIYEINGEKVIWP